MRKKKSKKRTSPQKPNAESKQENIGSDNAPQQISANSSSKQDTNINVNKNSDNSKNDFNVALKLENSVL